MIVRHPVEVWLKIPYPEEFRPHGPNLHKDVLDDVFGLLRGSADAEYEAE
jgi:hypothetical protein